MEIICLKKSYKSKKRAGAAVAGWKNSPVV